MRHQAQKGFCGIFVGIPKYQKQHIVYVTSTRKVISSYDVVFDESFFSALSYTIQPYSEAMVMRPEVRKPMTSQALNHYSLQLVYHVFFSYIQAVDLPIHVPSVYSIIITSDGPLIFQYCILSSTLVYHYHKPHLILPVTI